MGGGGVIGLDELCLLVRFKPSEGGASDVEGGLETGEEDEDIEVSRI